MGAIHEVEATSAHQAPRSSAARFSIGFIVTLLALEVLSRIAGAASPEPLRWYDAVTQLKVEQMDDLEDADVIFIGTSMAWQAFVPQEFTSADELGRTAYNAGLAGGVPQVMQRWALEEVVPRLDPATVVWGISSLDVAPEFGSDGVAAYDDALETRRGFLSGLERLTSRYVGLIRYRPLLRSPSSLLGSSAEERRAAYEEADEVLGAAGERASFEMDTSAELAAVQRTRLAGFLPDPDDIQVIRETIEQLTDRGIEVIVVELPVPERFVKLHPQGDQDHTRVGNVLSQIAADLDVRFLRMAHDHPDADFVDFTHLSSNAATQFTRAFARELNSGRDESGAAFDPPVKIAPTEPEPHVVCRTEFVVDEYGDEIEVEICEEGATESVPPVGGTTAVPFTSVTEWLGSRDARNLARAIEVRWIGQVACVDPGAIVGLVDFAPPTIRSEVAALAEAIEAMERQCDGDGWVDALELATEQARSLLVALGQRADFADYTTNDVTERTAAAAAAMDHLNATLRGRARGGGSFSNVVYWRNADVLGLTRHVRMQRATAEAGYPDIGLVGTSVAGHAFDQDIVAELAGASFLNAAVAGADVEEWEELAAVVFGDELPETLVWGVTTHRLLIGPRGRCELPGSVQAERRAAMFAGRPELAGTDPVTLLLGPHFGAAYDSTPIGRAYFDRNASIGKRIPFTKNFTGVRKKVRQDYESVVLCDSHLTQFEATLESFEAAGSEVIVALLPSHQAVYDLAPDLHTEAREALVAIAESSGATVIEFAPDLPTDLTADGWHPNAAGRVELSNWLGGVLGEWTR